jgi:sugar phosphate isomerase/epimerase
MQGLLNDFMPKNNAQSKPSPQPFARRLAVCSWSLQPKTPQELIAHLKTLGIPRVQIALDPLRTDPIVWGALPDLCARENIQIVSGMLTTVGEDYSTLESIRRTGGVVPDATWDENWRNFQAIAVLAQKLKLKLVTIHAGFLPHEESDPAFAKLFRRMSQTARLFADKGLDLGFETGQETAPTLVAFLKKLGASNVGVNFDPANMILYDQGNPIDALRQLLPFLKQCHIKDAVRTKVPGTWGEEVPVGAGQVNWREFFQLLAQAGFAGYCAIEREAGSQRVADIRAARVLIESLGV